MSDKQMTQTESPRPQKRGCVGFMKRFWWAILLVLAAVVVLVVCLIIFVGVKNIAQDKVNKAKLDVQGLNLLQATNDKFLLQINSTLSTDGGVKANIDPFVGSIYLTDAGDERPFLQVDFPATNGDKHQVINITQEIEVGDRDAFNRFNVWFFNNETLRVTVQGKTKIKPAGLNRKYNIDFKKTLEVKGLNAFNGTTVTGGEILLKPVNGANFKAVSHIPNPSFFTLDVGNATFANSIDGTNIGTLWINDLVLRPGMNDYPVTASLDEAKVFTLTSSANYCKTGVVPVNLHGTDVQNHGEKLTYYALALGSASQTVSMDIGSIIRSSLHLNITCPKLSR